VQTLRVRDDHRVQDRPEDVAALRRALDEARAAGDSGEVPIGAVVVDASGTVIGVGRNEREATNDPTSHAEVVALRAAGAALGDWRLEGCTLAVTLEPCPMCAWSSARGTRTTVLPDPCGTCCATAV